MGLLLVWTAEGELVWEDASLLVDGKPWNRKRHLCTFGIMGNVVVARGKEPNADDCISSSRCFPAPIGPHPTEASATHCTWHVVRWARYAARRQGLTAVPVLHGSAAVVTTTTCTARKVGLCQMWFFRCGHSGAPALVLCRVSPGASYSPYPLARRKRRGGGGPVEQQVHLFGSSSVLLLLWSHAPKCGVVAWKTMIPVWSC